MTPHRGFKVLAKLVPPRGRWLAMLTGAVLVAVLAAWAHWYRPQEAHYRGRPTSYWAGLFLSNPELRCTGQYAPYTTAPSRLPSLVPAFVQVWWDSLFQPPRFQTDPDAEPVLAELLRRPNEELRLAAARMLTLHGSAGIRQAVPVLMQAFRSNRVGVRDEVISVLSLHYTYRYSQCDPEVLKAAALALRELFDEEADWRWRVAIVNALRTVDGEAANEAEAAEGRHYSDWNYNLSQFPTGWTTERRERSGVGFDWPYPSDWQCTKDPSAPGELGLVLAQTVELTPGRCNFCLVDKPSVRDVELTISVKARDGKSHQGGGLVWRYQYAGTYYLARLDPLEGILCVEKLVGRIHTRLAAKEGLHIRAGEWHTLVVRHVAAKIECSLDGEKCLEANDSEIDSAGRFGLWTEADARTYFANSRMTDLSR
jgi:hypothetical protein